ncbi:sulfite exporter TauE/SafE family protein [Spirosoma taeanense]|uniref:Probable membrane transporter protein n=1 Tax=Spirosoma taeanense TaxID=2735870 RepID=A0A6M5YD14_9BACT|nr:sulfite exporter TauE/SafE family protein [Spirosoma taeanense]QJW91196.1 sulfite exporter TauE/SafE family protein [Spirosoma taeanense]
MTSLQLAGFGASIFIGVSLGLLGGGGSILTLPVLVYLLGINPIVSTVYSLFVVGTTSLVGSVNYMRQQQVNYKAAMVFSIPSFLAVYLTRNYLLPVIPDPVLATDAFVLSKDVAIMLVFSVVMLAASVGMIREQTGPDNPAQSAVPFDLPLIAGDGILVGVLTGIVGAGGGFLIIPALVMLVRLPMKMAVGTSLLIIAANTLIGFWSGTANLPIDWPFLLGFTAFAVLGILLGTYLTRFIAGNKLKKAFGWFVLIMGVYILTRELFL